MPTSTPPERLRIVLPLLFIGWFLFSDPTMAKSQPSTQPRWILYQVVTDRFSAWPPPSCEQNAGKVPGKDFRFGGNILGLQRRLDYIGKLGVHAIWISPLYQGLSAERNVYHGYAPLKMDRLEPALGDSRSLQQFMAATAAQSLSVVFDFVFNHTADVIRYRECESCPYRNSPYTPFVPPGVLKSPAWLNEISNYHNQGELSGKVAESFERGDLWGLDDLNTDDERVQKGLLEIHSKWINDYRPQVIRIDSARNVSHRFLKMIADQFSKQVDILIENHNEKLSGYSGLADPRLSYFNFPFFHNFRSFLRSEISAEIFAQKLREIFSSPISWINFISSHDLGRVGRERTRLNAGDYAKFLETAHFFQFVLSTKSTVYYGDEQGFRGEEGNGEFDEARENQFALCRSPYGSTSTDGLRFNRDHFDATSPFFRAIKRAVTKSQEWSQPLFRSIVGTRNGLLVVPFPKDSKALIFNFSAEEKTYRKVTVRPWGWKATTTL